MSSKSARAEGSALERDAGEEGLVHWTEPRMTVECCELEEASMLGKRRQRSWCNEGAPFSLNQSADIDEITTSRSKGEKSGTGRGFEACSPQLTRPASPEVKRSP